MHSATLPTCIGRQTSKSAASAWPLSNIMRSLCQREAAGAHAEQTTDGRMPQAICREQEGAPCLGSSISDW